MKTPDIISTTSPSFLCVVTMDCPGRLRSRSGWMSPSESGSPAGMPSTTVPTPFPWLSPKLTTTNLSP